ncbi:hypothetical protein [Staphylococcus aureus]
MENNFLISDAEPATFVKLAGNIITVETKEFEYDFRLTDAQLEQCYQKLSKDNELNFIINPDKGIIVIDNDYDVTQQSEIDNIEDYFFAIEDMPITSKTCEIVKLFSVKGKHYAEIETEDNEHLTLFIKEDVYQVIKDTLQSFEKTDDIDKVYFSYSPEFHKIILNDMSDFDEGDLQLGNMMFGDDEQ